MPYGGGYRYLSSKNSKLNRCNFIKNPKRGAILIEFAFAVPVLFSLIYYVQDLARFKRYYSQTKFSAEMIANILQNVSQQRTNKAITKTDMKNAFTAAFFNIYPDNNFSPIAKAHKHGHWGEIFVYYVKGNNDGTASVIWPCLIHHFNNGGDVKDSPSRLACVRRESSNDRSHINIKSNAIPSSICPELSVKPGEYKAIVETCIIYDTVGSKLANGASTSTVSLSKILGFYLITPKYTSIGGTDLACFNSNIIFTPKPGLFSETIP